MEMQHLDGKQVTLPLFDKELLTADEEMAQPIERQHRTLHIAVKGGVGKGSGSGKRMFVAGSIRRKATE